MSAVDRPLLTVDDLAERLSVSPRKAAYLVNGDRRRGRDPEIPSLLIGTARRIRPDAVDAWLAKQQDGPSDD